MYDTRTVLSISNRFRIEKNAIDHLWQNPEGRCCTVVMPVGNHYKCVRVCGRDFHSGASWLGQSRTDCSTRFVSVQRVKYYKCSRHWLSVGYVHTYILVIREPWTGPKMTASCGSDLYNVSMKELNYLLLLIPLLFFLFIVFMCYVSYVFFAC